MSQAQPLSNSDPATVFCGIDVSARTLAVAVQQAGQWAQREFANNANGHKELIVWLHKRQAMVRVSLEATGIYSLDLALALHAATRIELAVLNPRKIHEFAKSMRRSKTDRADARVLAEFSQRMAFVPWQPPHRQGLQLRTLSRHIQGLTVQHTRERNRLHAVQNVADTPRCVLRDLKRSLASLEKRQQQLRREAGALIQADPSLRQQFHWLLAIPGIAQISAIQLLAELTPLAQNMTVRQWVAHSGLDPVHHDSGSSVHKPSHISRSGNRHLRRALYMPALVAVQRDPHIKAFYLLLQSRHKTKMQALIAVARKLLHAIHGIFRSLSPYDGHKLFPALLPA